ncbi:MAG: DUF4910 domain-containing protein [Candidatus Thorarchaeota archaeon]
MKIERLVECMMNGISSSSIMKMVSSLSQFHRIQGSKGYLEAANYIKSILNENGLKTKLYEFAADGKWEHWGWKAPISWDINDGECWLTKPIKKRLCSFKDIPMSVITHSRSCDFEAPLIDVGKGETAEDYENAKGKIALITGSPRSIFHFAAQHDVKGLIIHPNPERTANLGANTVQYDGFWPSAENLSKVSSGFSITHRQAIELQKYLEANIEVTIHFKINAEFSHEGKLHVLETEVIGSKYPEEEIVLIAHLCHPASSANDNASGSATLAEIVLSLNRLIQQGFLPLPERTLRFLWVPEFSGTIPWMKIYEDQRDQRKILSVFNLDMVGESSQKIGSPLTINCPSCATPSYLKALLNNISKCVSESKPIYEETGRLYQFNYRLKPFAGGSDHLIFNDQYFSIPSVMFGHEDPFHHSSADSVDKVDPLECKSVAVIAESATYGLSLLDNQFIEELLNFVFLEGVEDILRQELSLNQEDYAFSQDKRKLELLEKIILHRMKSILELKPGESIQKKVEYFSQTIKAHFSRIKGQIKTESEKIKEGVAEKRIKRNYLGPLSYKKLDKANRSKEDKKIFQALAKDFWGGIVLELLNLADGVLTIEEIYLVLTIFYPNIEFDNIVALIKLFQKEGILVKILD